MSCAKFIMLCCALSFRLFPQNKPTHFEGKRIILSKDQLDDSGQAIGYRAAFVYLEAQPKNRSYTAPAEFIRSAKVQLVQLNPSSQALLFSAESYRVSGWKVFYSLLQLDSKGRFKELFDSNPTLSSRSTLGWIADPSISVVPTLVTFDAVIGFGETNPEPHRCMVSVYVYLRTKWPDEPRYVLADQFLTVKRYDFDASVVLLSEKPEILSRLKRVLAEWQNRNKLQ